MVQNYYERKLFKTLQSTKGKINAIEQSVLFDYVAFLSAQLNILYTSD